ncbi:MAG: DUF4412 domain-containing protein [Magnetococcus sp. XQGC-1]
MPSSLHRKTAGLTVLLGLSALLLQPDTARAGVWYPGEFSADIIIADPRAPDAKVRGTFYVGKDRFRAEGVHDGKKKAMIVHPQERKVWMLFPEEKTYFAGPGGAPIPPKPDVERLPGDSDGPCKQDKAIVCAQLGTEKLNGIETEKWEIKITPPPPPAGQQPPANPPATQKVLVWADTARHIVVKQQPEAGPSMERTLVTTEKVADRMTEKWTITHSFQGNTQKFNRWVDSKLRVPVREEEDGKAVMELVNIQEKAQPAALFEIPKEFKEIQPPPAGEMGQGQPKGGESAAPPPAAPGKLQYR